MPEKTIENRTWIVITSLFGASAVSLGAFGSHGLRNFVSAEALATWRIGVDYQMFHTLALLALTLGAAEPARYRWTMRSWSVGILLFSGSLYALVLSGLRTLGMITPLGGLCFIAGWLFLVWVPRQRKRPPQP